jgi:predicted phosphoribosyltransferase
MSFENRAEVGRRLAGILEHLRREPFVTLGLSTSTEALTISRCRRTCWADR